MSEAKPDLDLDSLVTAVRDELEAIDRQRRERGQQALLQLAEMELEINFVVTRRVGTEGKIDLKIFSLGADANVEREKVQKIRLKFNLADTSTRDESYPVGSRLHSSAANTSEPQVIVPLD